MPLINPDSIGRTLDAENALGRRITAVEERALGELDTRRASHKPNFAMILDRVLEAQAQSGIRPPSSTNLLSINPHLNLKVISLAHPGASLSLKDGALEIKQPDATLDHLPVHAPEFAVRQLAQLGRQDMSAAFAFAGRNQEALESPFGSSVAPSGLAGVLMGRGVPAVISDLNAKGLQSLLAARWQTRAVDGTRNSDALDQAITHWDKLGV